MALAAEFIEKVAEEADRLFAEGARDTAAKALKAAFPDTTFTFVHESTMVEDVYREGKHHMMYLVDAHDHCWVITGDPEKATGFVIAEPEEEY